MKTIYVSRRGETMQREKETGRRVFAASLEQAIQNAEEGDTILLDSAEVFVENPVVENKRGLKIGSFGIGRAVLHARNGMGLLIRQCENILVCGVILEGTGWKENESGGIHVAACKNVRLFNLEISGFGAYGIAYAETEKLHIDGCYLFRNGAAGICAAGRSRSIHISHCKTNDNPGSYRVQDGHSGSGIIVSHTDGAVVEFCEAAGNGWAQRQTNCNGPVGIWCWGNAKNILFRYNIAHHNRTQPGCVDGDGFDIDGGAKHVAFEHCYSYENEAAGYLLCEYGSEMGWFDNHVRDCASICDATRVTGYGSVHLYCPPHVEMDNTKIERNLLIPQSGSHAIGNREAGEGYTNLAIQNNWILSDRESFACPVQPQIEEKHNTRVELPAGGPTRKALPLTEPRALRAWPPFSWAAEQNGSQALWLHRLSEVTQPADRPRAGEGETHLFSLLLNGPDLEGSFQKGDCRLVYDSLRPGVVSALSDEGAEISSFLPGSSRCKKCVLKAYGRSTAEEMRACLFVREKNGAEARAYFGGSVSGYQEAALSFTPREDGVIFGIRKEQGAHNFLIDRIDVFAAEESRSPTAYRFTAHCSCSGNAYAGERDEIVLENGGSMCCVYLDLERQTRIRFEARGDGGAAFFRAESEQRKLSIAAKEWTSFQMVIPKGGRCQVGFCIPETTAGRMEIRGIAITEKEEKQEDE